MGKLGLPQNSAAWLDGTVAKEERPLLSEQQQNVPPFYRASTPHAHRHVRVLLNNRPANALRIPLFSKRLQNRSHPIASHMSALELIVVLRSLILPKKMNNE